MELKKIKNKETLNKRKLKFINKVKLKKIVH